MLQTVIRKVQISRQLQTKLRTIRRLGESLLPMTSQMIHQERQQGILLVLITIQQVVRSVRQGYAAVVNASGTSDTFLAVLEK